MQKHNFLTWLEISRQNLLHNLNQFKKILPLHFKLMAVIKSNAYGHGLIQVANIVKNQVDCLVVACIEDALTLRDQRIKKPILVLSNFDYYNNGLITQAVLKNIDLGVSGLDLLKKLNHIGCKINQKIKIHLKIDTGMTRFGVNISDAPEFIKTSARLPFIKLEGIYSHLSVADENLEFTNQQLDRFDQILDFLKTNHIKISYQHIANTAGSMLDRVVGNDVRLGKGMYGCFPSAWTKNFIQRHNPEFTLKPVLTWKTKIVQIKKVPAQSAVSYGRTYITPKSSALAVLPIGYWNGFDRGLSNKGEVLIHGQRCPVRGRVCMNQTIVDVSALSRAKIGDEAVLLGAQCREKIPAEEMADKIGTINYEVVARINPLLPRVVI